MSLKPLGYKNYGSIPHLSTSKLGEGDHHIHEGQNRILTQKKRDKNDLIIVTEKYDGSNVGVCKKDGEIYALTRSGYEAKTSKYNQHILFSNWVNKRKDLFDSILKEGERLAGEWLVKTHSILYTINGDPFVVFDVFNSNNQRILQEDLHERLFNKGLKLSRVLHVGDSKSPEDLYAVLYEGDKNISCQSPEGMVYRVERNGVVDFLGKWVRQDFEAGLWMGDVGAINNYNVNL